MFENADHPPTPSAVHEMNNHLMVAIGLSDLLEIRLRIVQAADLETIQLVRRIRRAAVDAADAAKQRISDSVILDPSKT